MFEGLSMLIGLTVAIASKQEAARSERWFRVEMASRFARTWFNRG